MVPVNIGTNHVDYFQGENASRRGLPSCFGIRVEQGRYVALVKIGDGIPFTFGQYYPLPVKIDTLPNHLRMIVDDHILNLPSSDLADVLVGRKSFEEALKAELVTTTEKIRFREA